MLMRSVMVSMSLLIMSPGVRAQAVNLTEAPLAQRCVRNELTLELEGKITVKQGDKDTAYPHKAGARHVFMERFLDVSGSIAHKAARYYTTAEGTITFNNNESSQRSLRAERRFLVAQRTKDRVIVFSPAGPLLRPEMELTEHFDTLAIAGLLPGKALEVGKSWAVSSNVVAALCDLDGVTEQNVEGKLEAVKDDIAHLKIVGKAQGISLGAQVGMLINARCEFDVKRQAIVFLEWKESDERQQGPVTPALCADVTITLKRAPIEEPEQLNKFALVPIPTTEAPPANLAGIRFDDARKRFAVHHARNWHVVSPDDSEQLVMRHLERGEFLAQVTFTPWKKGDAKNPLKLDDFADLMTKTPGWALEKETERKTLDVTSKGQQMVHRIIASGELDGVRTVQYFYLIAGSDGQQLIVTFSVVPQHTTRLGSRDLELIREITFPE